MTPELLEQMFRLRYRIFHQQLSWEVDGTDGMERDTFDGLDPVYVIAIHRPSQAVVGCARLLPTTGPHMLRDIAAFQPALHGRPSTRSPHIWEISRLAIAPRAATPTPTDTPPPRPATAGFSPVPRAVLAAAGVYATAQGIRRFITLSSIAVERKANASGIPTTSLGARSPTRIGTVLCTAYSFPVTALTALARPIPDPVPDQR
jgi:acyl homoserine lactone synthase